MTSRLAALVQGAIGRRLHGASSLAGGCVGEVRSLDLDDGTRLVAKLGPGLGTESFMLNWLTENTRLPIPRQHYGGDDLIIMDFIETSGPIAQEDAADHLAALHEQTAAAYGFVRDTVIGSLPQPNPPTPRWVDFFRLHRLLPLARDSCEAGLLPTELRRRIDVLADRLEQWLDEPAAPSLIHGDAWGGNLLCHKGRVAAFIDPAIYYADAEIELAFGTLFGTFDARFFARYAEHRPLRPGFWEARRDILNLYPLLVHVRLFGGSYVEDVEGIVRRFVS